MPALHTTALRLLGTLLLGTHHRHAVRAHRSLPSGLTCGAQFGSPDSALVVPNPTISWANYGVYTCDDPVQWYEAATVDAGQMLYFTLTVPEIERFREARMSAAIVGPGLPPAEEAAESVPAAVMDHAAASGLGIAVFDSPADQSTCGHLTSELMFNSSTVKDGRCHFYEPFGGSNLWVVLDEGLAAPEVGTYKIAVYETNGMTAKASFACCDWPEDFITAFELPETECDLCGARPAENPAWSSMFYEHKSMEGYGGYPPFQRCDGAAPLAPPQGESCPPAADAAAVALEVSESCRPHCGRDGVCHNHNILGDCSWAVDWALRPKLGEANVTKIVMFKGDTLRFQHSTDDGLAHNLFQVLDGPALETCAFDGSSELANVEDVAIGHEIAFDEAGEFHFTCSIGCGGGAMGGADSAVAAQLRQGGFCHCRVGQRLTVEVKDASEGMRCHSHGGGHGHDHAARRAAAAAAPGCEEGSAAASVLGDAGYGAGGDECAELCAPAIALAFMAGVEEGGCASRGYADKVAERTVRPPGSPMEQAVTIYARENESDCHCHSYEEIVCPGEDASDALYDEHIEEITNFCQGVLEGAESECPYQCYQPMEVLHLHYLECPSRRVHETYAAVNAKGLCHGGSTDVPGDMKTDEMCPVVEVGSHDRHDEDGHDLGHSHDHGHGHDHDHGHGHSDAGVGAGPVTEDSAPGDESAAPCATSGSIFMAGLLSSLALSFS